MGNMGWTFRVAFSSGRHTVEADSAKVSVIELDSSGDPTGSELLTDQAMTQYHPGLFTYASSATLLTRGKTYRATYDIYWQGDSVTPYETQTQDFTARGVSTDAAKTSYTFTLVEARKFIRKALGLKWDGATEADNQNPKSATCDEIANLALERLWREQRWMFQAGDPFYIDFVAHQYRYALPADFLAVKQVYRPNSRVYRFEHRTKEWIRNRRENAAGTVPLVTYYAIDWDPPSDLSSSGNYIIDVWPTPAAYVQDAAVLDYDREAPKLVNTTDIIPIPKGMQSLFQLALRAEACEQENRPNAPRETAKFQEALVAAARHDGRHASPFVGPMNPDAVNIGGIDPSDFIDPESEVVRT